MDHTLEITLSYQCPSKARVCPILPTKRDNVVGYPNQVQRTDNRVSRIMASCKATALYVPVTVHREQSVKKEYQQDATI